MMSFLNCYIYAMLSSISTPNSNLISDKQKNLIMQRHWRLCILILDVIVWISIVVKPLEQFENIKERYNIRVTGFEQLMLKFSLTSTILIQSPLICINVQIRVQFSEDKENLHSNLYICTSLEGKTGFFVDENGYWLGNRNIKASIWGSIIWLGLYYKNTILFLCFPLRNLDKVCREFLRPK